MNVCPECGQLTPSKHLLGVSLEAYLEYSLQNPQIDAAIKEFAQRALERCRMIVAPASEVMPQPGE